MAEYEQIQGQIRNSFYGMATEAQAATGEQEKAMLAMDATHASLRIAIGRLDSLVDQAGILLQGDVGGAVQGYTAAQGHMQNSIEGLAGVTASIPGDRILEQAQDYK